MGAEAAVSLIQNGSTIGIGGFGISGHPMALLYQLVRQEARELTLVGMTNGNDADLLVGAGCIRRLETAAVSLEEFGLAPNVCRGVESGQVTLSDYTESTIMDRFLAGSMGLSFFPTRVLFGSDVARVNPDIREILCPYTGERYHTVPPARPQWALIHALASDVYGNVLYPQADQLVEMDRMLIRAADQVIVSVEKIVSHEVIQESSYEVIVPAFKTAAVVEVPFGTHPCSFGVWYNRDTEHLQQYVEAAQVPDTFKSYLDTYVLRVRDRLAYVECVGGWNHLMALRSDGMVGL